MELALNPVWRRVVGVIAGSVEFSSDGRQVHASNAPWPVIVFMFVFSLLGFLIPLSKPFAEQPSWLKAGYAAIAVACVIIGVLVLRLTTFSADKRTGRWRYVVRALVGARSAEGLLADIEYVGYQEGYGANIDNNDATPSSAGLWVKAAGKEMPLGTFHGNDRRQTARLLAAWLERPLKTDPHGKAAPPRDSLPNFILPDDEALELVKRAPWPSRGEEPSAAPGGLRIDAGYLSPHFITDTDRFTSELEDAFVLVTQRTIVDPRELVSILEKVAQTGRPVLVVASAIEDAVLALLVLNRHRGMLRVCAIAAKDLEAVAHHAGCEVIRASLEGIALNDLGAAKHVSSGVKSTVIQ